MGIHIISRSSTAALACGFNSQS